MNTISYTAVRSNLSKTMEKVCNDHTPIIITRKSEHPVIMISLEDYESLEETAYLLRSPNNARRLLDSVAEVAANETLEREIKD
ncbi:MAG: type II toxin-antitoxin system prevent-host-death family antitoxin [Candidatus Marinimicrobia bacterium]|nr:type II toxin-antitoxin system prevent-host-death family antitoxin [Candidatus Neomarinimicrobiota bacterium]